MNRRDLIAGTSALAGARVIARGLTLPRGVKAAVAGAEGRQPPREPLLLNQGELAIVFDPDHGVPYSVSYKGKRLLGEDDGQPPRAVLCRLEPREYHTIPLRVTSNKRDSNDVSFDFKLELQGSPAARFQVVYSVQGAALLVRLLAVEEQPGFEVIEVAFPKLVVVREENGGGWMAEGRHGGSFVTLGAAKAYRVPDDPYFGRISTELPIGMVGQTGVGCVMEVTGYMDATETEISGSAGSHHATLGTVFTHRVHGGRCYDMNDGGAPVCGGPNTPNLLVGQPPLTRFDFFLYSNETQPWLTGAKIARGRVPASPTQFFGDRFLYIVAGRMKTEPAPRTTFAQSRQMVHDVAMLTDYAPQTVLLSGWVYDGQDTGYPSEDKVNASLGSYEELRALIEDSKQWNANVTVNVNYDDAYKSSPIFDEAFIARRPDAKIWKSRDWDGEDSYVVGMAKFMEGGWGARRIAYTVDHYKVSDAMLIDAMSWFAVRNDWDPKRPASGYKNLVDGKYKIIEGFRARGVSVTSEQMRYPFIGKLAVSMDGPGISHCPFGGEAVPLVAAVYRGAAIWGSGGLKQNEPQQQLFYNTRSALWFRASDDRAKMADFYYLVVLPFSKLHALSVDRYDSHGSRRTLTLAQGAEITMDLASETYSARVDETQIAADNATFCPIDSNRVAFYSRSARRLQYPLPAQWDRAAVTGRSLTLQGRVPYDVQLQGGLIVVDVLPSQPVIVYASEHAIRQG